MLTSDGKFVVSQAMWDETAQDVRDAITKCGVTILSNEQWDELGKLIVQAAKDRQAEKQNASENRSSESPTVA